MIIFDPLAHVKAYTNSMHKCMRHVGIDISLVQREKSLKYKILKFLYYYYILVYHLYIVRNRIIFNIPLLPLLDFFLVSMSPRNDHILVVHNSTFGHSFDRYKQYFYELYIKQFRYFITHSYTTQDFLDGICVSTKSKFQVLNYTIPWEEVDGKISAQEKTISLPDKYFLFCGSVKDYKGVDILLDAVKYNPQLNNNNFKLILAGNFGVKNQYLKDEFLSLDTAIEIFDWILTDKFMDRMIEKSSCLVLPYKDIDNSGVFAQAKYYKVPVISSDIGIFREENIDNLYGRQFKSGSNDELSKILEDLWYNQVDLQKIKVNCLNREVNSWQHVGKEIKKFVENLENL